jgi:hypothetical protein
MSENLFLKPAEFYKRDVNPIKSYIEQMSFYISKMTNKDIEKCKEVLIEKFKTRKDSFQNIKDPTVKYFERNDVGDKSEAYISLSSYINEVNKNEELLAPTFTTYLNTKHKRSMLVGFIDNNVKRRSIAKKEAFKAKSENNDFLYIMKNNEQNIMKLFNNSMSGAFATKGSILHNPTGHSTLTSVTRTEGSLGNASNEKIIAGNRHYRTPDTVLNNLIAITSDLDREAIQLTIENHNMKYPTANDVVSCIKYSSDLYWKDEQAFSKLRDFIDKLDEVERAGFVYTGDMYHMRVHNEELIRSFLVSLSTKVKSVNPEPIIKIVEQLHSIDEQIVNFGHLICSSEVKGRGKKYQEMPIEHVDTLLQTCRNIENTLVKYKLLIDTFFLSKHIPSNTAYIRDMVRRVVVLSDTDSTMFSTDEYINWHYGSIVFNDEAFAFASAVMFVATQCIAHTLAIFSANLNVERPKLFNLAMKPEYSFPVFAQTPVAKHYYTFKTVQEGNVFSEPEMEIKGVHLKNSAAPKSVIKPAHEKMKTILEAITRNEKISILKEIKDLVVIERNIIASVLSGDTEFYKQSKIKAPEAYSREKEMSPYLYHMFWEDIFQAKYGQVEEPAYNVIKIPTIVENITGVKKWLSVIKDEELARRLEAWLVKYNKRSLPTIYISTQYVKGFGIPEEIKPIINVKKIVLDLTLVNRMILESLGYCPKDGWLLHELGY